MTFSHHDLFKSILRDSILIITLTINTDSLNNFYYTSVTVHTAGRDEEHADEEVLQNNSL